MRHGSLVQQHMSTEVLTALIDKRPQKKDVSTALAEQPELCGGPAVHQDAVSSSKASSRCPPAYGQRNTPDLVFSMPGVFF